jgi:hypothetical protein
MDRFSIALTAATLAAPALSLIAASPWAECCDQARRARYWSGVCGMCVALTAVGPSLLKVALG